MINFINVDINRDFTLVYSYVNIFFFRNLLVVSFLLVRLYVFEFVMKYFSFIIILLCGFEKKLFFFFGY